VGSLSTWFNFGSVISGQVTELENIFPLEMQKTDFIRIDATNIYSKILTDTFERTHGISNDTQPLLFDNCHMSDSKEGLITMLAKAMVDKKDLFIVYDRAVKIIRKATGEEQSQIRADYEAQGQSSVGSFISFKNYDRSDMVLLFSALEYATTSALNKDINVSNAIQFKMKDLRGSTALVDKAEVEAQAKTIAKSLGNGKDVLLDKDDMIETSNPDLTSVKEAINFINQKRSFYLGLPESYISGILAGGLGDSGEADTKAIERGLKNYFFAIIKPVCKAIFDIEVEYKSQDFRMIDKALNALQSFSLADDDLLSREQKQLIINKLFDIEATE
jgi:hypothetical protein